MRRTVRWWLLAAITFGAFLGAMSCAADLAMGGGHSIHAAAADARPGQVAGHIDDGPAHHAPLAAVGDAPSSTPSDGEVPSRIPVDGEAHPGTACVTSVQLRVPDLIVPAEVRSTGDGSTLPPADRATEPEPPVPRSS